MTTPEAAATEAALYEAATHSTLPNVAVVGLGRDFLAALHDAGYALTPLAPEVPPRRDGLRAEMEAIFERFFHRSFEAGYSFVEFLNDALAILDRAAATRTPEPPDSEFYADGQRIMPDDIIRAEPPDSGDGAAWAKAFEEWRRNPPPLQVLPRDAGIDAALLEAVFAEAVARGVIVLPDGNGIRSVFADLLEAADRLSAKGAD